MKSFTEFFLEYRHSAHNFQDPALLDAYKIAYKEFINQGFRAASTFAIWDYIYRLIPDRFKSEEIAYGKKKSSGTSLRPFVIQFVNQYLDPNTRKTLAQAMVNPESIRQYLNREEKGNRRKGLLNKLSAESGYEVKRDF